METRGGTGQLKRVYTEREGGCVCVWEELLTLPFKIACCLASCLAQTRHPSTPCILDECHLSNLPPLPVCWSTGQDVYTMSSPQTWGQTEITLVRWVCVVQGMCVSVCFYITVADGHFSKCLNETISTTPHILSFSLLKLITQNIWPVGQSSYSE